MNLKKIGSFGLALGLLLGTATNAQAWWHRSAKTTNLPDNSSMKKTSARTINLEFYNTAANSYSQGKLCNQTWYNNTTTCSSTVTVSGKGHKTVRLGGYVSTWKSSDFGTIWFRTGSSNFRGVYMSN